ncbi:PAS domain-containing protein [Ideonella sp.]|uniref:PAS domain-containing protein n=1 Tax=Ideonella sp. TaxID=1929293 RepID=UPI0035B31E70
MKNLVLRAVAAALDGVEIAFCAFDRLDRALAWNSTFLDFFPEHRGQVHVGEPYADNLRRFYMQRLDAAELPLLQRYIDEGIARHRSQCRPYEFDHRGARVRVSSVEMGAFGRIRVWRRLSATSPGAATGKPDTTAPLGALPIESLADGVLLVDASDHIVAANPAFLSLYRIESAADITGQSFEQIYRRAWAGQVPGPDYRKSLDLLKDNQRFSGAPYELALPGSRWVRIIEQRGVAGAGRGCFVHVDITNLKRQEQALRQAEASARHHQALYRLLAESSRDVTLAVAEGEITYASPSILAVLGWQPHEQVGRPVLDLFDADDAGSAHIGSRSARGSMLGDQRVRVRCIDGSYLWMEARTQPAPALDETFSRSTVVINLRSLAARGAEPGHGEQPTAPSQPRLPH